VRGRVRVRRIDAGACEFDVERRGVRRGRVRRRAGRRAVADGAARAVRRAHVHVHVDVHVGVAEIRTATLQHIYGHHSSKFEVRLNELKLNQYNEITSKAQ